MEKRKERLGTESNYVLLTGLSKGMDEDQLLPASGIPRNFVLGGFNKFS
jgi:hypothetical protein